MASHDPEPWAPAAIRSLDVRPGDRVLACCVSLATARMLAAEVGREGLLMVVGDARTAHQLANLRMPWLQAYAHALHGGERFGTFDAVLVCAMAPPPLPLAAWAALARDNLRLGGRVVLDLPGARSAPDLDAAAAAAGWPADRLAALAGVDDAGLVAALTTAGLRDARRELAATLLRAGSPADAVAGFARPLDLDDAAQRDLAAGLVRHARTTGPIELLVHRTRVVAKR